MKKIIKTLIVFLLIVLAVWSAVYFYLNRMKYNDAYVNGNSSGNLYNAGLFCESNGTIFFANPDDKNYLYSMSPNGKDLKRLCKDSVMYINADENYIYYIRNNANYDDSFFSFHTNSLCRIPRSGGKPTVLDNDPCIYASLIGNYIYYLHYDTETATTLYKIKIDGTEKQQLSDSYLFTCNAVERYFYYNNPKNGQLYRYNTQNDQTMMMLDCSCYKPIVTNDDNAYYLDVAQNNALVHTNLSLNNPITLTTDFIELYNIYGSYIYYQRGGDHPALCMIKNDGTSFRELASGEYSTINITSESIYFTRFGSNEILFTSTQNPGVIQTFHPGKADD